MELTAIVTGGHWENFNEDKSAQKQLLAFLPDLMVQARWFGGKGRAIKEVSCDHCLQLKHAGNTFWFFIIAVDYHSADAEYYTLPLARSTNNNIEPKNIIARLQDADGEALMIDATHSQAFQRCLFEYTHEGKVIPTNLGRFNFDRGSGFLPEEHYISSVSPNLEQSNSSIFFNDRYFMKIYRKLFGETNPEVEMLKFLTEQGHYEHVPAYAGSLIWERDNTHPVTLTLMMQKIHADKDSWSSTGDELNDFLHSFTAGKFSIDEFVFEHVELLARRTAEMHLALSHNTELPAFAPEVYTTEYREWLFKHLQHLIENRLQMVEANIHKLDDEGKQMVNLFRQKQKLITKFFRQIKKKPLKSLRTRIHGDYHLGQLLYTGSDYIVIDFEGEPESSITERKIKHSPLKDVAGMVRSFHYAVSSKLYFSNETKTANLVRLQRASDRWFYLIRDTFINTYMETMGKDNPLFPSKAEVNFLFMLHMLEKAIYELGYELNGRPTWVKIPLRGIEQVINELEKYLE